MSAETNSSYLSIQRGEVFHTLVISDVSKSAKMCTEGLCRDCHAEISGGQEDKLGHFNAMPAVFRDSFSFLENGGL